ncbi:hypothetical protein DK63_1058 [Brucella melitensis bv. 1 str. 16M]|nr:hypothetical protein DK63_1058 [Brucella melitensis bv. 1 str. 16M]
MLYYVLVFLVVALVAGALGFGGIAGASAGIAQILFFFFLRFWLFRSSPRQSEKLEPEKKPTPF